MILNENSTEIEAKILDVSHSELEKKILQLGGIKVFDGELDAVWLQNVNGKKIRVRKEGEKVVTEYKEKKDNANGLKESLEIGYSSDNFENQLKVLEKLGLTQISRSIKRRVSYVIEFNKNFGKTQLDFDNYSQLGGRDDIPELLEIEAASDITLLKVAELLGFTKDQLLDWDAGELLEYYNNK